MSLPHLVVQPPEGIAPTGLVLWLHGLGADGHDFAPVIPMMGRPDLRYVLPHAPTRPVTINGGMPMPSWYDIRHLEAGPDREPEADIRESATALSELLRAEQARAGVPWDRVVVVGFSQGGAMALHLGLRWPERLGGIVALSTYLVLEDTLDEEASEVVGQVPAFVAHGVMDPTVEMVRGRGAARYLDEELGMDVSWNMYGMEHEVCGEELDDLAHWLDRVVPRQGRD